MFATLPDVVGDAAITLQESEPWLVPTRRLRVPTAFVAQDGSAAPGLIPWGEFSVLFLGGSDEFKLGDEGALVTHRAWQHDVPVHMGRVNSLLRMGYAKRLGCSTVDGTYLTFGPDKNLRRLIGWHKELGLHNFDSFQIED